MSRPITLQRLADTWDLYRLLRRGGNSVWWSLKQARQLTHHRS